MEYQLAFSPDLGIHSAEFVEEWNNSPEYRTQAEARLDTTRATQFDPSLVDGAIAVLTMLGGGIATNAIYDLIKGMLVKKGIHKHTQITRIDQNDGTHILIVTIDEE